MPKFLRQTLIKYLKEKTENLNLEIAKSGKITTIELREKEIKVKAVLKEELIERLKK